MRLSKTDYLIYRECAKNAWLKIHRLDIYRSKPLSVFDEMIISVGNEVDSLVRSLFPGGSLVSNRDDVKLTADLISARTSIIYQPVFETEKFKTICDILVWNNEAQAYDIYEAKASTSGEDKKAKDDLYAHDLAFQYLVLSECGYKINKTFLVRLNKDYSREEKLDINELFTQEDFTEKVFEIKEEVALEMKAAQIDLSQEDEPRGHCSCILKGRSAHCTTFSYSNPEVPAYSVHDISRIGLSKKRLAELIDSAIFSISDIPEDFVLSEIQRNQVDAAQKGEIRVNHELLAEFFKQIKYPIAFLDYETFPAAVPRFIGYHPYDQIPFQFSLHVLEEGEKEPKHFEFIHAKDSNPDKEFIKALLKYLPSDGSIIVWNKSFEANINKNLGRRNPEYEKALDEVNERIIDLEDPFKAQHYIHPGFKGKTSIKYVLPSLAPEFSYKALNIQEGATASNTWNDIVIGKYNEEMAEQKRIDLLSYCELDTYAMYAIWKHCQEL